MVCGHYIIIAILVCSVTAQFAPKADDECYDYDDTCRRCIQQPNCQWCTEFVSIQFVCHSFRYWELLNQFKIILSYKIKSLSLKSEIENEII